MPSHTAPSGTAIAPRRFNPALNLLPAPVSEEQAVMKLTQIQDPFHNPFHNRFHVPVHSRLDEMQAYTHMVWLNDPPRADQETQNNHGARPWGRALAGAFAALMVVVVFSAALLSNAFGN